MIKILITLFLTLFGNVVYSQKDYFDLILCIPNYNRNYNNTLPSPFGLLPPKIFKKGYIHENTPVMEGHPGVLSDIYFIFYEQDSTLQQAYRKGVIPFPFFSDSNFIRENDYSFPLKYHANFFCTGYPTFKFNESHLLKNIFGIYFSINLFNDDFCFIRPYFPLGMVAIPVKLFGELSECNYQDIIIPNWNRKIEDDEFTQKLDSIPIFYVSKFDSLVFYNGKESISKFNKKYTVVCSKMNFIESAQFIRILKRNFTKADLIIPKNNTTPFNPYSKLQNYFQLRKPR